MRKVNVVNDKVKFKAFGKTRKTKKKKEAKKADECECRVEDGPEPSPARRLEEQGGEVEGLEGKTKCQCKENKAAKLLAEQGHKLEEEINVIKREKQTKMGRIFKLKESVLGGKKNGQETCAIRDPETEELLISTNEVSNFKLLSKEFEEQHNDQ